MKDLFGRVDSTELPTTEEEMLAFEAQKTAEIEQARTYLAQIQRKDRAAAILIQPIGARHIDNEVLASACRRLTVRHFIDLISPAIPGGFCLPLELSRFQEKTFEELIYLLQKPCETTNSMEEG
ncbi:MAG: hypothetical protein FDZ69_13730 [Deltaproteobacteria bacterium]|nr:MAG: hypothetical protein FDZ69_13730 [Deltaproteobacteria bacterium]